MNIQYTNEMTVALHKRINSQGGRCKYVMEMQICRRKRGGDWKLNEVRME